MLDVAIIGSGPAGVAAAINVRQRNRSLVLLGAAEVSRKLESAQEIANYPGFPEIGGAALGEAFHRHLDALGIAVERKYVDFKFTLDERIVDGYYYAAFFKHFKRIIAKPEVLDNPPEEIKNDID